MKACARLSVSSSVNGSICVSVLLSVYVCVCRCVYSVFAPSCASNMSCRGGTEGICRIQRNYMEFLGLFSDVSSEHVEGCGIIAAPVHAPSRAPLLLPLLLSTLSPSPLRSQVRSVMGSLVHTGLGSSSLVPHVLHSPPPPTRTALSKVLQ